MARGYRRCRNRRLNRWVIVSEAPAIGQHGENEHKDDIVDDISIMNPRISKNSTQRIPQASCRTTHEMITRGRNRRFEKGSLEGRRSITI